jgi:DNA repair photolyase
LSVCGVLWRSEVTVREVECRSLLSESRLADYCINPYIGCQHACRYCYAESYTRRFSPRSEAWGDFVDVKINAPAVLSKEIRRRRKGEVFFSSLTDPYQPLERKYELTRKLLGILLEHQFPISIQTKSALVLRDLDLIQKFERREVGFTITTFDDNIGRLFEPASSPAEERLQAIRRLKREGVRAFIFFGPMLPYISDRELEQDLRKIAETGVDYIYVDRLNMKPGLWPKIEGFLQSDLPPLHQKWESVLIAKSGYYQNLKTRIDRITRELGLEVRFCF